MTSASGTFPYPYAPVSYTAGPSTYVAPIKYPYGAPALPVATPAVSPPPAVAAPTSSTATAQAQERPYNDIQWKQPYVGPCDLTPSVEQQVLQNESTPSGADAHEPAQQHPGGDVSPIPNSNDDNATLSTSISTDSPPVLTPSPTDVTA